MAAAGSSLSAIWQVLVNQVRHLFPDWDFQEGAIPRISAIARESAAFRRIADHFCRADWRGHTPVIVGIEEIQSVPLAARFIVAQRRMGREYALLRRLVHAQLEREGRVGEVSLARVPHTPEISRDERFHPSGGDLREENRNLILGHRNISPCLLYAKLNAADYIVSSGIDIRPFGYAQLARSPSLIHPSDGTDSQQTMFVVSTLVGLVAERTLESYPPPVDEDLHPGIRFHTTVDDLVDPKIFRVYQRSHMLPAYRIHYRLIEGSIPEGLPSSGASGAAASSGEEEEMRPAPPEYFVQPNAIPPGQFDAAFGPALAADIGKTFPEWNKQGVEVELIEILPGSVEHSGILRLVGATTAGIRRIQRLQNIPLVIEYLTASRVSLQEIADFSGSGRSAAAAAGSASVGEGERLSLHPSFSRQLFSPESSLLEQNEALLRGEHNGEQLMFVPSAADLVQARMFYGLDVRINQERNGRTDYGVGTYAGTFPYALTQAGAAQSGGHRYVVLGRAFTGLVGIGEAGMRSPPQLRSEDREIRCHSLTDNLGAPSFLVLTERDQFLPLYLIMCAPESSEPAPKPTRPLFRKRG